MPRETFYFHVAGGRRGRRKAMRSNPRGFLFSIIFIGVAAFMMACGGDDSGGGGGDPLNPNGGSGSNPGAGVDADLRLVGGDPITLEISR